GGGAIAERKKAGPATVAPADVETVGGFEGSGGFPGSEFTVLLYEFKADLNAYLATLPAGDGPRSLAALIEFNDRNRDREMPYFAQEVFVDAQKKGPLTEKAYRDALA